MRTETADYLTRVYESICRAWGAPEHQAKTFARAILEGDLVGRPEQGMKIVQIDHLMASHQQVNFTDEPTLESQGVCHAVMNGHKGLGQYILTCAMEKAIALAKENTIGMVWVYNWLDIGCVSGYARLALEQDMVGLTVANTLPMTAPYGGRDRLMSVAPFSFSCPAGEQSPILGDVALSQVYDFHSIRAVEQNQRLGGKWMVDPDTGKLTDDPAPYVADPHHRASRIRAAGVFADPRLYCLNVFGELMTGLTTAGGWTTNQQEYPTRDNVERGVQVKRGGGAWCMAINVGDLMPIELFKEKVDSWVGAIKSSGLAEGFDEIKIPGERALKEMDKRLADGIPIRDDHWAGLVSIAKDVGVDVEALR